MGRPQSAAIETASPHRTVAAAASVEVLGVGRVDTANEPRQRVLRLRNDDEVDVVRHPAPAEQLGLAGSEMESQELLVAAPVFVRQEDVLAVIAALGDVMRYANRHHSRWAGHQAELVSVLPLPLPGLQVLWAPSPSLPPSPRRPRGCP
jgi:hypothetical protein